MVLMPLELVHGQNGHRNKKTSHKTMSANCVGASLTYHKNPSQIMVNEKKYFERQYQSPNRTLRWEGAQIVPSCLARQNGSHGI